MSELLQRFANLPPEKRQLVLKKLQQQKQTQGAASPVQGPPILPVTREGNLPLSFSQMRFWLAAKIASDDATSSWSFPIAVRLRGSFCVATLQQSLDEIVRRHEIIRTTFTDTDGEPRQVIARELKLPLSFVDYTNVARPEQAEAVRRLATAEAERPFDLGQGPLLRPLLVRLSGDEYILCLTFHHIVLDGWSESILTREVTILYDTFRWGEPSPLDDLPIQYADYAVWQQEWLEGEVLEELLSYWREQLGDNPAVLDLPLDRPRQVGQVSVGGRRVISLPPAIARGLRGLANREASTLFMSLLAGFYALLYRYTGQQDLSVGTIISNRTRSKLEGLIGLFLNTLVLRTDLGVNPTFRDLLKRVRQVMLGVYAHQELPFEKLLEELQPERHLGAAPLFRVMFGLQNAGSAMRGLSNLDLETMPATGSPGVGTQGFEVTTSGDTFVDLALFVIEGAEQLGVEVYYNVDLFDQTTVARMMSHYERLLEGFVTDADRRIDDYSMLGDAERHQLLVEWNDSGARFDTGRCFHEVFEAQAARTPDSVAALFGGDQLTYSALNRRANGLALTLRALGVGQEQLVGVIARRDIDFLSTIIALFKAGGAYLPLDPSDPHARVAQVLGQSGCRLVLHSGEFRDSLSEALESIPRERRPAAHSIEGLVGRGDAEVNVSEDSNPRGLSYVIYTSGSTGVPKGAMIEHAGMLNHLYAKVRDLQLTADDVVAQTASQCFDISVWQFLVGLLVGGRVSIVNDEAARDPWQLLGLVEEQGITILETVPSLLRAMFEEVAASGGGTADLKSLRWLLATGEALPPGLCRQWLGQYERTPLLNAYGPTECSDDVTHHPVPEAPPADAIHTPIGRPVSNTDIYILHRSAMHAPIGVPGELFVGGAGVGRGYVKEAGRTAEVFTPDPYSGAADARLYRTGDLARYRPDGSIEFLGRIDHQVKIRGHRIELGEIEAAVNKHPAVREAVVVAREDESGDKRIVAYVVPAEQDWAAPGELQDFLRGRLPDFMVPSAVVKLDALPLNPNGKIDRRALPAPDRSEFDDEQEFVEPETPLEIKLAGIWGEIIKVERISIYHNFFALGGHSLMATRVIYRVNRAFDVNLSVRNIFEEPTIAGLALCVEEAMIERLEQPSEVS